MDYLPTFRNGSISDFSPLPQGPDQYNSRFVQANGVIKLTETDDLVIIGTPTDTLAYETLATLRLYHRKRIEVVNVSREDYAVQVGLLFSGSVETGDTSSDAYQGGESLESLAQEAPTVNLVNSILLEAYRRNASDAHIEAQVAGCDVRVRVDGLLRRLRRLPSSRFRGIAARIKILCNLNVLETRVPQDGRMTVVVDGHERDIRVSFVPTAYGESIVLRLLGHGQELLHLEKLGMAEPWIAILRERLQITEGLWLFTGPTGSGKTTTMNAILNEMSSEETKCVAIEDPVEYELPGVTQIQTNATIGLTFDSLLRRVLRHDPDIIMVGEIRDVDTARLAIRAAMTGHLVLSTLHTTDSVSAVSRLFDMGIEGYLVAATLKGVIAQRLVRLICPACGGTGRDETEDSSVSPCVTCLGTGHFGRRGVFEVLLVDGGIRKAIAEMRPDDELRHLSLGAGLEPLAQSAVSLLDDGLTSPMELQRLGIA